MGARLRLVGLALPFLLQGAACRGSGARGEEEAGIPGASATPVPQPCARRGEAPRDPVSAAFFPDEVAGHCLDPLGDPRVYGEGVASTLKDACARVLDAECDLYRAFGLSRLVTLRYVDGRGGPGFVAVRLSRFQSREDAFAFYTRRVVGEQDPATLALRVLEAGAGGALGDGVAYVARGEHVLELAYVNEGVTPGKAPVAAAEVLPLLARDVGARLPGDTAPPAAVTRLPREERLPLAVAYAADDVLGMEGLGPGAVGHYRRGEQRYRVLSLARHDDAAAGDAMTTLRKRLRPAKLKDLGVPALTFELSSDGGPRNEWVVIQVGKAVLGVGDDEPTLPGGAERADVPGPSLAERDARRLSRTEKVKLLRRLLASAPPRAP